MSMPGNNLQLEISHNASKTAPIYPLLNVTITDSPVISFPNLIIEQHFWQVTAALKWPWKVIQEVKINQNRSIWLEILEKQWVSLIDYLFFLILFYVSENGVPQGTFFGPFIFS